MTPLDALQRAVRALLAGDAEFAELVDADAAGPLVQPGYPEFRAAPRREAFVSVLEFPGLARQHNYGRASVTMFAPATGPTDPDDALAAMDGRLRALVADQRWSWGGWTLHGIDLGGRSVPGPVHERVGRMREFRVSVITN